jgi:hypothetical protein
MFVSRFPPSEVAARIAVSLGIGLLVGIKRGWSNKAAWIDYLDGQWKIINILWELKPDTIKTSPPTTK